MRRHAIKDAEVISALVRGGGRIEKAAKLLGISRITFWRLVVERNLGEKVDEVRADIHRVKAARNYARNITQTGAGTWPVICQLVYNDNAEAVALLLRKAIIKSDGSPRRAARKLTISLRTYYRCLKPYPSLKRLARELREKAKLLRVLNELE